MRLPDNPTREHFEYQAAVLGRFDVQVGGFADWVQDEISFACTCGAPTELLLQFSDFDPAMNLGDSGRAYVFGCTRRHAPDAFFLAWQTT